MSWATFIHGWGSSSSVLLSVVVVAVIGAGLSFVGGEAHLQVVYVIHGWGADVHGLWLSYTHGGGAIMGHL